MTQGAKQPGGIPQVPPSVWTDGTSILGNGTQSDPLTAGAGAGISAVIQVDAPIGSPMAFHTGFSFPAAITAGLSPANSAAPCWGILLKDAVAGDTVRIQSTGIVTLTAAEWNAVAGGIGGLTPNRVYYTDHTTDGKLTTVAPTSGQSAVAVGISLNTTQLLLFTPALGFLAP